MNAHVHSLDAARKVRSAKPPRTDTPSVSASAVRDGEAVFLPDTWTEEQREAYAREMSGLSD
jgi:hypothetical protein